VLSRGVRSKAVSQKSANKNLLTIAPPQGFTALFFALSGAVSQKTGTRVFCPKYEAVSQKRA